MASPSRPLALIRTEDSPSIFESAHSFLTDMWGSHRGAAPNTLAARDVNNFTNLPLSKSPSGQAYIVFWAIVAFQLFLIIGAFVGLRIMKKRESREIRKIRQEISEAQKKPNRFEVGDYMVIHIYDSTNVDEITAYKPLTLQEMAPAPPPAMLKN
ncbi:hypothetical protein DFP73DRAFT_591073 [Morchella snyderi]|nr:hypothetical protein DFP73DRAFT_602038 [Morchella snyderi]KAI5850211.1 hypothetical protein DFP73DRAFT_591073 [Morchella snyderi]